MFCIYFTASYFAHLQFHRPAWQFDFSGVEYRNGFRCNGSTVMLNGSDGRCGSSVSCDI